MAKSKFSRVVSVDTESRARDILTSAISASAVQFAVGGAALVRMENGKVVTDSLTVGDVLGRRHDHVLRAIDNLIADGTLQSPEFGAISYRDARNRAQRAFVLTEEGALIAMPFIGGRKARAGQAMLVKEFFRMRDHIRDTQAAPMATCPAAQATLDGDLALASAYANLLKVSPSGRITLLQRVGEHYGLNVGLLPSLVVDAPSDSDAGSSEVTAALSALLKEHGLRISAMKFYRVLEAAGIVVRNKRSTTRKDRFPSGIKEYWSFTSKGLAFGKNMTDSHAQRETAPHFYVSKFNDLRDIARPFYAQLHDAGVL